MFFCHFCLTDIPFVYDLIFLAFAIFFAKAIFFGCALYIGFDGFRYTTDINE